MWAFNVLDCSSASVTPAYKAGYKNSLTTTNHQRPILMVVSDVDSVSEVTCLQKDNDPVTILFLGPCVDTLASLWNIKIKL